VERRVNVGDPLPPGISERRYEELLMNAANAPKHPETLAALERAKARGVGQPRSREPMRMPSRPSPQIWMSYLQSLPGYGKRSEYVKSLEVVSIPFKNVSVPHGIRGR
jgi:hypothetical protein